MPLPPYILNNFWLKIFSLILACLIWFAIQSNQSGFKFSQGLFSPRARTLELRCSIRLLVSPNNHSAFIIEPQGVIVKIDGEDSVLKKLTPESIQAYVVVSDAPNPGGQAKVEVTVPDDVALREVVPDHVSVQTSSSTNK
jgi:YbbR domain-containing protein